MSTEPSANPSPSEHPPATAAAAAGAGMDPEVLKKAYQAFKKRIKLARLDDESRLGHGPLSNVGKSSIVAITPPHQYPRAVWDELVRQGKLRYSGHGLYELAKV